MVRNVTLTIDHKSVTVPENTTILEAARSVNINIPTLCYLKDINEIAACRVCVVEVEGYDRLMTACNNTVTEGMVVYTNSRKARLARRANVELILSQHDTNCAICVRSGNCELQKVANDLNILSIPFEKQLPKKHRSSLNFPLIRNYDKCIKCMRCVQVCDRPASAHSAVSVSPTALLRHCVSGMTPTTSSTRSRIRIRSWSHRSHRRFVRPGARASVSHRSRRP